MQITAKLPKAQPAKQHEMPADVTVTYNKEKDCYDYEAPGFHRQVCRQNPFKAGAQAAALVGVPSLLGAVETVTLGLGPSILIETAVSPTAGALLGGAYAAKGAWEETHKNPIFTGLATLLGAGVGMVGLPLLKAPGTFGGLAGALGAAGIAGVGVGIWTAHQNYKADQEALAHGYNPGA